MREYSPEQIRAELGRVLASKAFASSGKIRRFLDFAVEHAIHSGQESLKEIIIGNELYATNGEFDPRLSAVVRVDATRLRSKLRESYATEGLGDPLLIDLPKVRIRPCFGLADPSRYIPRSRRPIAASRPSRCYRFQISAPSQAITLATV